MPCSPPRASPPTSPKTTRVTSKPACPSKSWRAAAALLAPTLQLRAHPRVLFAGQISGVEGYVESIATGLMAGLHAAALALSDEPRAFPRATALGSLCQYISGADPANYQPANITF